MLRKIDNLIDRITMYRLVLYYLIALLGMAFILSLVNVLPYQPLALMFSPIFLIAVCWVFNKLFARIFNAPTNLESLYITALILSLIMTPPTSFNDVAGLFWAGVLAMASKYIFSINKKHVFNPVAIAVLLTSIVLNASASWWVGTAYLAPVVVIGGLLIMRKTRREDMVFAFLITALLTVFVFVVIKNSNAINTLQQVTLHSSLFFMAFAMLTEPYTLPPTKNLQIIYAIIVGILFSPDMHLGSIYTTPEIALLIGNLFTYLVSPKFKLILSGGKIIQTSPDTLDFVFKLPEPIKFSPGQYLEFTLPHHNPDSRGTRRYFTIASSPTEHELRLGVKFYPHGSTYKKALAALSNKDQLMGAQLAGDFTLPKDHKQKLVFIAGGIGITPFRSMLKYLADNKQRRNIVMFYANKKPDEIIYDDVFDDAYAKANIKTVYTLTDQASVPKDWIWYTGRITPEMIKTEVPDYQKRTYYLSGPHSMVEAFQDTLAKMGINRRQIVTDFFPGLV